MVPIIGIIDPSIPSNSPSIINGILMLRFDAPISLIIPISVLLELIVILIVFEIKNAVTIIRAATAPIHILCINSKVEIN